MSFPLRTNFSLPINNQKGSLLVVVLVLLTVLSLFAFSIGYTVRQKLQVISRFEAREKLRLVSEAAARRAAEYVREKATDPSRKNHALNETWARGSMWKNQNVGGVEYSIQAIDAKKEQETVYGLIDEERKINPNSATPQVLQRLFQEAAGVDSESARQIVSSIRDWIDEDEHIIDGGAESKDYMEKPLPYRSKNAPISVLKELLWVKGITPEIFEKVEPYLTLDANRVNLNTASPVVLSAMGLNSDLISKVILYRNGKDEEPGTADDGIFISVDEVPEVLGRYIFLNDTDKKILEDLFSSGFSVNSTCFTARIFAKLKHQSQSIRATAVIAAEGIRRWHEEFF